MGRKWEEKILQVKCDDKANCLWARHICRFEELVNLINVRVQGLFYKYGNWLQNIDAYLQVRRKLIIDLS
jgi:hypothetical protein